MESNERTKDIFEHIKGYQKPPLIPLPEAGDLSDLEEMGLKPGKISHGLLRAALKVTGFSTFEKQLPNNLEHILRRSNLRGAGLFAPIVSATVVLIDDPRDLNPFERAATMLIGTRQLYDDLSSAALPQDMYGDHPLEMGQYPNMFSTSLTVEKGAARLYKSNNTSQITVLINGNIFLLQVGILGVDTSYDQLVSTLEQLHNRATSQNAEDLQTPIGVLTCASHAKQIPIFSKLRKDPSNRKALNTLRESFTTLCLDLDQQPVSYEYAGRLAQSTNCYNRWHHASVQIVVFGNARACTICNFNAYVDGNAMARGSREIYRRAVEVDISNSSPDQPLEEIQVEELHFSIDTKDFERVEKDIQLISDDQQATYEFKNIGRRIFAQHEVPAVPAFILALQLAALRTTGEMAEIIQFMTMSRYRCMDLTTAVITTPEVSRFINYLNGDQVELSHARELMQEAIDSQVAVSRRHRKQLNFSKILGLFVMSKEGSSRTITSIVLGLANLVLRILGLYRPPGTDIVVSHPNPYEEIPVFGRPGIRLPYVKYFGLHYQIFDNKIVTTFMPSVKWQASNQKLFEEIQRGLDRILWVITG